MYSFVTLLSLWALPGLCLTTDTGATDFSKQFDFFVGLLKLGLVTEHVHQMEAPDFHGTEAVLLGNTFSDPQTLARNGPIYMKEPKVDYMTVYGSIGFGKLELNATSLRVGGKEFAAVLRAKENNINFQYTLEHKSKRNCVTSWEKFTVTHLAGVTITSAQEGLVDEDITDYFNAKILPDINKHLSSPGFLYRLGKDYDFCISRWFPV